MGYTAGYGTVGRAGAVRVKCRARVVQQQGTGSTARASTVGSHWGKSGVGGGAVSVAGALSRARAAVGGLCLLQTGLA